MIEIVMDTIVSSHTAVLHWMRYCNTSLTRLSGRFNKVSDGRAGQMFSCFTDVDWFLDH